MNLQTYFDNFLNTVGGLLPGVLGALLVLIIGYFIAKAVSRLVGNLIRKSSLDQRVGSKSEVNIANSVQKLMYYIMMVVVLLVVLEMLGVENVLEPLEAMLAEFLGFIPNLVAAGVIAFAGYIIAQIVSELVGLASDGIESFASRMGMSSGLDFTKIIKQLVFIFIFIPILILALDALQLKAVSEPATMMLGKLIGAIPNIIAAAIILAVFYIVGKYVTSILSQLLKNLGADQMATKLGLTKILGANTSLSNLAGSVAFFFIVFTGLISALEKLEFTRMTEVLRDIFEMTGQIFFGLVILVIGNMISIMASKAVAQSENSSFLSSIARVAVLGLFLAISLRAMGIANDIVELAFGLTLGSIAVAIALSFGLGGREAAGKQMEHILSKFRKDN